MKEVYRMFLSLCVVLPSSLCVLGTTWLIYHDKKGWGWLVFLAICLAGSAKFGDDK